MKKNVTIYCVAVLMSALCAGFAACNEPNDSRKQQEEGTEIQLAPASDAVADFFGVEKFPPLDITSLLEEEYGGKDYCVMVNSMDEFRKIYRPEDDSPELPFIDFDSHTLILGGFFEGGGGHHLAGQSVVVGTEKLTLYLRVARPYMGGASPLMYPFWGLYPKLPKLPVNIKRK